MADIGKTVAGALGFAGSEGAAAPLISGATKEQADQAYANTQTGLAQQQAFLQALQAQNGIQNQSDVYNQLGQVAAGQGPNPAQAMLAQQTQANIANQAALAAGQRGAGQNVGMIARQAGQQGGNLQQQSVGQGATMQAQQSLNALGQQGNMAGQMVGNLGQAGQAYSQSALGQQGNVLGAIGGQNQAAVQNQKLINERQAAQEKAMIDTVKQAGSAATTGAKMMASGGQVESGPRSKMSQHLKMASGGAVPVMLSPGEAYIPPSKVQDVAKGAKPEHAGRVISGKAKVKGDSEKNDIVSATLQSGGVVIPRTIMNAKDHEEKASKFVQAVLAKSSMKRKK